MFKGILRGFPIPGCRQRRKAAAGCQEFLAVSFVKVSIRRGQRRFPQGHHVVERLPPDSRQQFGGIGCLVEITAAVLPDGPVLFQPNSRIGVALELFIGLQHQIFQCAVIPSGSQRICQQGAAFVQFLIKPAQHPIQHPLPQKPRVVFVQHPEVRRQGIAFSFMGQQMGIFPQQRRAERVHGFDVRLIDPQQLAAEMPVAGRFRQPFGQLCGDLAPQLGSGGFGIGDDEEIVNVAVILRHIPKQPLHQHFGFAGTGGGGHQQAAAAVFHCRLLLLRQVQFCHGSPPPSSSSCQNSSDFTGRIYRR